jgi:hypothetical protein
MLSVKWPRKKLRYDFIMYSDILRVRLNSARTGIGCWSQGLLGRKEGRSHLYLFGVRVGERRAFNYYLAGNFQVYDIEADLRRVLPLLLSTRVVVVNVIST